MLLEKHISDMGEFQFPIINERIIPPTRSSMDRTSTSVTTALTALYPNLLVALAGVFPPPLIPRETPLLIQNEVAGHGLPPPPFLI